MESSYLRSMNNLLKAVLIGLGVMVLGVVLLVITGVGIYNRLVGLSQTTDNSKLKSRWHF